MTAQDTTEENKTNNLSEDPVSPENTTSEDISNDENEDYTSPEEQENFIHDPKEANEKIVALTAELESVAAKLADTHDRMLRIAAEAENTRKRLEKEKVNARLYSIQDFALDLLPVIDSFDKALQTIEGTEEEASSQMTSVVEGVKLVSKIFNDAIQKHGIERVPGKDTPFNPTYHNAIAKETDSKYTSEVVIEEFMTGYKINDRVLRTALVKVGAPD